DSVLCERCFEIYIHFGNDGNLSDCTQSVFIAVYNRLSDIGGCCKLVGIVGSVKARCY
ncbi:MAG: hypothetical protein ACJA2E_001618, partial [Arenicella sp.]